jgi:hypothetical protein
MVMVGATASRTLTAAALSPTLESSPHMTRFPTAYELADILDRVPGLKHAGSRTSPFMRAALVGAVRGSERDGLEPPSMKNRKAWGLVAMLLLVVMLVATTAPWPYLRARYWGKKASLPLGPLPFAQPRALHLMGMFIAVASFHQRQRFSSWKAD